MKEVIGLLIFIGIFVITIFLYVDRKINTNFACFLLLFSIAAGLAAANYDILKRFKLAFFELETVKKNVQSLKTDVKQTLDLKQTISTTVNNIVKVEKEIANIKEAIHQQYAAFKKEEFKQNDIGKRIAVYPNPVESGKFSIIFFELESIPEENSVEIMDNTGMHAPSNTYDVNSNIISFNQAGVTMDNFLKGSNAFYIIKYIPDAISSKKMLTIGDLKIIPVGKENWRYEFKSR
jgi:hypothetical protein